MIIAAANLSFASSHRYAVEHERRERLRSPGVVRLPPVPAPEAKAEVPSALDSLRSAVADLTAREQDYQTGRLAKSVRAQEAQKEKDDGLSPEQRKIIKLLETVFGAKGIEQVSFSLNWSAVREIQQVASEQMSAYAEGMTSSLTYDYQESYREYEAMNFALAGTFKTEDGREFSFDLSYQLEREYVRTTSTSVTMAAVQEPRILDRTGRGGFGADRTVFDRIGDAGLKALPQLIDGSNDRDAEIKGNRRVDDGGKWLGPQLGDGFVDRAANPKDSKGFISKGDSIWEKLRLWSGGAAEPVMLATWKVAAIALLSAVAPFSSKDADESQIGQNRSADASAGDDGKDDVVKQVDVVV